MSSSGEVDDILVCWGVGSHSMSCSGGVFQNLEATGESFHKSMVCSGESDTNQWASCRSTMSMVSSGTTVLGNIASGESCHFSMVCESVSEIIPQLYGETSMSMCCYGEVLYTVDGSEVLCFSRL